MSRVWLTVILLSMVYGILSGNLTNVNQVITGVGAETLEFCLPLIATLSFFNGILKIAEEAGIVAWLQRMMKPLLERILPDLKHHDKALGYISMNVALNMIGLGSAATPSGLKAMEEMQQVNKEQDTASRPMVTFIILNTAGVTFISTTVVALRSRMGSSDPTAFVPVGVIVTCLTSAMALLLDRWWNYRH